ncbi:MAG: Hint domain-containing protein [Maritimibacter sp.]
MPVRHLTVYESGSFRVSHGVNEGDPLSDASDLVPDDIYELDEHPTPRRLALMVDEQDGTFHIADGTEAGQPGAQVFLDCALTFMGPARDAVEGLVLVEIDGNTGLIAEIYLMPLASFATRTGYTLVTIDRENARSRLAASALAAFTRGTRITLANGEQRPIEDIRPGDKVLTRDSGPQIVRWVGEQTLRATGAYAPITIAPGTLNNTDKLVVSPNHRLFIYQRVDAMRAGRKELLIKANLLVNGSTVTQDPGGFVDYFQILFDKHEIIYAEGIAAESVFTETSTGAATSDAPRQNSAAQPPRLINRARELGESDLTSRPDTAEMLRRVSAL